MARFSFLVPSLQMNPRKSFYCRHAKYFAKENFHVPAWTSATYYCGNKAGNPEPITAWDMFPLARLQSLPCKKAVYRPNAKMAAN